MLYHVLPSRSSWCRCVLGVFCPVFCFVFLYCVYGETVVFMFLRVVDIPCLPCFTVALVLCSCVLGVFYPVFCFVFLYYIYGKTVVSMFVRVVDIPCLPCFTVALVLCRCVLRVVLDFASCTVHAGKRITSSPQTKLRPPQTQ